jgi:lipid II:glycine glycyltransferase (peptidoglycan interpeptide bridge formation enzyme)
VEILHNENISLDKWNYLLSKSPYASPFQTPAFYELFNTIHDLSAEVFAVKKDFDIITLCVVTFQKEPGFKGFFSRRAIIYGGPLLIKDDFEAFDLLLKHIYNAIKRKAIYIEVRNYFDYSQYKALYVNARWKWLPYLNLRLSLEKNDLDSVLAKMSYNRRREIRLSLVEGAIYREADNISEVEELYLILKKLYNNKIKLPIPNLEFFLLLFNSTIGKVFVVIHNFKIIGGAFCFFWGERTIYTMYYCGLRDYHRKIFPTHLCILAAVDFGIRHGLSYLDFMGAGLKNKEYGVRTYKKEFGGDIMEHGRFLKINNHLLYNIGEFGLKLSNILKK